jgi:hypothetical protein
LGVPLVVWVSSHGIELADELCRLGKWPSVFLVVVDREPPPGFDPRPLARNLLFAAPCSADQPAASSPNWSHVTWRDVENEQLPRGISAAGKPLIMVRRKPAKIDVAAARAACDRLQLDLAPNGDFAGYVV